MHYIVFYFLVISAMDKANRKSNSYVMLCYVMLVHMFDPHESMVFLCVCQTYMGGKSLLF